MPIQNHPDERNVTHGGKKLGNKTIEVTIRFWTDGITKKGTVAQKHAWDTCYRMLFRMKLTTRNTNEARVAPAVVVAHL